MRITKVQLTQTPPPKAKSVKNSSNVFAKNNQADAYTPSFKSGLPKHELEILAEDLTQNTGRFVDGLGEKIATVLEQATKGDGKTALKGDKSQGSLSIRARLEKKLKELQAEDEQTPFQRATSKQGAEDWTLSDGREKAREQAWNQGFDRRGKKRQFPENIATW